MKNDGSKNSPVPSGPRKEEIEARKKALMEMMQASTEGEHDFGNAKEAHSPEDLAIMKELAVVSPRMTGRNVDPKTGKPHGPIYGQEPYYHMNIDDLAKSMPPVQVPPIEIPVPAEAQPTRNPAIVIPVSPTKRPWGHTMRGLESAEGPPAAPYIEGSEDDPAMVKAAKMKALKSPALGKKLLFNPEEEE